eukprot:c7916_g2_i2.p1 GENE.c7916_g2_i2~~c7916_g2_i2.p1  ORF type:complete len:263 (+),score=66.73 c7916_g2_i2:204-992(+)
MLLQTQMLSTCAFSFVNWIQPSSPTNQTNNQPRINPTTKKPPRWWREALNDIYKQEPPQQPMARALAHIMKKHNLSKRWFAQMIQARSKLLSVKQPYTLEEVEQFGEGSQSCNLYANLDLLAVTAQAPTHAASHAGQALGIVNVLRTVPFFASKRRLFLPVSLMAESKVSSEEIFRGENTSKLSDVVYVLANRAFAHVENCETLISGSDFPKEARPALYPVIAAKMFLEDLQQQNFNVFDPKLAKELGHTKLQWHLFKESWK